MNTWIAITWEFTYFTPYLLLDNYQYFLAYQVINLWAAFVTNKKRDIERERERALTMFDIHCVLWFLVIAETGTNGRWWLTCKTDLGCSPNSFSNLMWNCSRSMWIFYNKEWPVRLACLLHVRELMLNLLQTTPEIHLTQSNCEFCLNPMWSLISCHSLLSHIFHLRSMVIMRELSFYMKIILCRRQLQTIRT